MRKWLLAGGALGSIAVLGCAESDTGNIHDAEARELVVTTPEFEVPPGYNRFTARGQLSPTRGSKAGSIEFLVLTDAARLDLAEASPVSVSLADLGITGPATVRDLWQRRSLGGATGVFRRDIPLHGAGLYRISPQP